MLLKTITSGISNEINTFKDLRYEEENLQKKTIQIRLLVFKNVVLFLNL